MTVRVTGTVLDERGNGVPWVSISNGEFVVRTDACGRYEIDAEPGSHSFITVSVPDTHRVAGAFYRRVPMTDTTIDFELHSTPERQYEEFTLAQITDTHVRTEPYYRPQGAWLGPETGPRLTSDLRQLERESTPDLVLATGDLTDIGTTAELEHFRNSIAPIKTPIRPVYGGHDGHVELEAQGGNRDKYEYVEGVSCIQNYQGVLGPVYYSFDWGGRHFVAFSKEDSYFTQADIARKDRWLIEDLSAQPDGRETVLFMPHSPCRRVPRPAGPIQRQARALRAHALLKGLPLQRHDRRRPNAAVLRWLRRQLAGATGSSGSRRTASSSISCSRRRKPA